VKEPEPLATALFLKREEPDANDQTRCPPSHDQAPRLSRRRPRGAAEGWPVDGGEGVTLQVVHLEFLRRFTGPRSGWDKSDGRRLLVRRIAYEVQPVERRAFGVIVDRVGYLLGYLGDGSTEEWMKVAQR